MNDDQLNKLLDFDHQQINIPYIPAPSRYSRISFRAYILDHQSVVLKVTARRWNTHDPAGENLAMSDFSTSLGELRETNQVVGIQLSTAIRCYRNFRNKRAWIQIQWKSERLCSKCHRHVVEHIKLRANN